MPAALKATSSSACMVWARYCTTSCSPITRRRPVGSMLQSAAIAIFSPIWCGVSWRMARTRPSSRWPPIRRSRLRLFSNGRRTRSATLVARAIAIFPCRATFMARSDAIPPAWNSATGRAWMRCSPTSALPGPTGEANELRYRGRGVFVCISPWNFSLSIFLGQITAALVAGNTVVAKPAEQTPLVAAEAVRILHEAGVPASALHLSPGDGKVGAALVADRRVAGVVFTGSTEVGRVIHRALASKDGAIVPLIAETGGINPMIVDATALPEQVTDDVITSAFRSAGQRCSALRLLCLQEDIAEPIVEMIAGAARELKLGDPREPSTHVGPVIDAEAKEKLDRWIADKDREGRVRFRGDRFKPLPGRGTYVPPAIIMLDRARDLRQEVFGPVLHVVRWRAGELDALLEELMGNGHALTLGIHSRIDAVVEHIAGRLPNGNVYVNRSMIGAVVGTQPFGGI